MSERSDPPREVARRDLVLTALRPTVVIVVMLLVYAVAPLGGSGAAGLVVVVTAVVGLVVFSWVFVYQLRRIRRSATPTLTAVEALVLVYGTFLIQFAVLYVALSQSDPAAFDEQLNRVGGLYLSITVLSTVGFGDITASSDLARIVVSLQMLADLALIGTAVRVLSSTARKAVDPRALDATEA